VHVAAGLAAVALTAWHAGARPVRPRAADLSRRAVLRGGLLAGGSLAVTAALPSAGRAPTRSLDRGSFDPAAMPVTSWLDDDVPEVGEGWRLVVAGRPWSLADLDGLGADELVATLDCTGGWWADQAWSGVRLDRLLAASGAGQGGAVEVRSLTGYARRFPRSDAGRLLVATRAGGAPLSPGHGRPARLVAPGRRGFWWVKWLDEVRVDDRPWWWQPPAPLT
jgi:DMSO/TMAO reductase YedYZ molybdopterin-dependent catalytic subunit